ncbi:VRR-NUC domain-containing protein [Agrobacterium sp. Ap1]|uniref:VRR-NUC domain-containing protein n=1 Tax=Agrobacterium sp. Ap1 TaxID=2815337 RepID=UPI001A8D1B27|nr:VRR-NUC domain-containing protein [Agrobacterium sp. Ap1]MBO0141483.1 VRR-NUC domain-containing protein [Agrobacterium sp. Ap1]
MRKLRESDIQKAVMDAWRQMGFPGTFVGAIPNAGAFGQPGLTKGLPDLILIAPKLHGYLELKTETGKLSGPQQDFQSLCIARGIPFYVTYGRDEPIRLLEELGIVRKAA